MPTIRQLVNFLRTNHVGKANSITASSIAHHFHISDGGVEVETRNIIRDAIERGELIGSSNRGFYIINELSDIEHNLNSLKSRAREILSRRQLLRSTWNRVHPGQRSRLRDINPNILNR